ncbi:lysylphosphatidylglycerol synthase transmembrane domain-containing protein [Goodfellowiella coeruleoviolacea]|uniref:Flippase-like domain-containing protein n=1 Tax=Goodfellowiella coeruleoviolacea TaxID=334858 RepID=A0AAE3GH25_9PSEU|nr:flippase-like domain-containing protein [Goodfellowiella coeruleoviolacea]MCP2167214.1 hypothetical protein [Goodfellowiella coeruleoviolacea]
MGGRWVRVAAGVAVVVVLAVVVWLGRAELPATWRALGQARRDWLLAGGVLLVLWWASWLLTHLACRRVTGVGGYHEVLTLTPVTLAAVALNLVVKSGGLAGLAVFAADARRRRLTTGGVTGAYLVATLMQEVAFVVVLLASTAVVVADARITKVEVAAVVVFLVTTALRVAALVAAARSRELVERLWTLPARVVDRLLRRPARTHDTTAADELFEAMQLLRRDYRDAVPALGFALGIDVFGAAMLWASLAAVGGGDRPVVALVAYSISAVFGILGFLPGGLGFVEVGAVAVVASFGVPVGVSAAAVIVFRVYEYWLPVLVGLVLSWLLARRWGRVSGSDRQRARR